MIVVAIVWAALMAMALVHVVRKQLRDVRQFMETIRIDKLAHDRARYVTVEGEPGVQQHIGTDGYEQFDGCWFKVRELVLVSGRERIVLPLRSSAFLISSLTRIIGGEVYLYGGTPLVLFAPIAAEALTVSDDGLDVTRAHVLSGAGIVLADPGTRLFALHKGHPLSLLYIALILAAGVYALLQPGLVWHTIMCAWILWLAVDGLRGWPGSTRLFRASGGAYRRR